MTDHPTTEGRPTPIKVLQEAASEMLLWIDTYDDAMGHGYCAMQSGEPGESCTCGFDDKRERWKAAIEAAALPGQEPLDVERPTDAEVTAELHRVLCMNAKHRSRFTGQCSAGPNIARGLRARLRDDEERP